MKKLLLLILSVSLFSCTEDEPDVPNRDLIVFNSTIFASEPYEKQVEVPTGIGMETETQTWIDVVRFKDDGSIESFSADEFDDIRPGTRSTTGAYRLNYPEVEIIAGTMFDTDEITIQKRNDKLFFMADGKLFEATLTNFE